MFGTGPHGGKKLRKVGDYIHNPRATDPNPQDKVTIGGVEFAMACTRHSNAGKILLPHYMEGALRILREMIVDDCLPMQQVINHINNLIQIAGLAQTTPWSLVRNYDTIYRREQHQHWFA